MPRVVDLRTNTASRALQPNQRPPGPPPHPQDLITARGVSPDYAHPAQQTFAQPASAEDDHGATYPHRAAHHHRPPPHHPPSRHSQDHHAQLEPHLLSVAPPQHPYGGGGHSWRHQNSAGPSKGAEEICFTDKGSGVWSSGASALAASNGGFDDAPSFTASENCFSQGSTYYPHASSASTAAGQTSADAWSASASGASQISNVRQQPKGLSGIGDLIASALKRGLSGVSDGGGESLDMADVQDKIQAIQNMVSKIDLAQIGRLLMQNKLDLKATLNALVDEVIAQTAAQSDYSQVLMQQSMAILHNDENNHLNASFIDAPHIGPSPWPQKIAALPAAGSYQVVEADGRRRALLIGINYTGTKNQLNGCNEDIRRVKNLLNRVYGFPDHPASITVLSDDACTDRRLYPTRNNILNACDWLVKNARSGDVLFFQYSGHGSQKRNLSGTEVDGFDETILPLDYKTAGQIRDNDLHEHLVRPLPAGVKLICILDCCHSGSGMDLPYIWEGRGDWTQEPYPKHSAGDVVLLSSCTDEQTAADVMIPGMGSGGALSLGLIMALNSEPFNTSFGALLRRLREFLRERKFKQKPLLSSSQKFDLDQVRFNFIDILRVTDHAPLYCQPNFAR